MEEEQVNEAVAVDVEQLAGLKHIGKRVKNAEKLTKHTIDHINNRNFLNVDWYKAAHPPRTHDSA